VNTPFKGLHFQPDGTVDNPSSWVPAPVDRG
jgi:hypothetical protein